MIYPNSYQVKTSFGEYRVVIELAQYANNRTTCVKLLEADDYAPFATISKNLDVMLEENEIYVDKNNCPWAEEFLQQYDLGENLNDDGFSGYCQYPKYRLNLNKITKMTYEA